MKLTTTINSSIVTINPDDNPTFNVGDMVTDSEYSQEVIILVRTLITGAQSTEELIAALSYSNTDWKVNRNRYEYATKYKEELWLGVAISNDRPTRHVFVTESDLHLIAPDVNISLSNNVL